MSERELNYIEKQPRFNIEKRMGPKQNEVSFSPERGGIITSLKLKDKEILYLDMDTFNDNLKNVKGGVPILFPNAGPLTEGPYPLEQHGFARDANWTTIESAPNEFITELKSDESTKEIFPFNFKTQTKTVLEEDGSASIYRETTNLETDKDMPLSEGLHPYFPVPENEKKNIKFDFPGGDVVESEIEKWTSGTPIKAIKIDNPKVSNPEVDLNVTIPGLGTLVFDFSPEYKRIWVWSQEGKDFICIEPVMRDAGGLVSDPEFIKPQETFSSKVNIRLEN